MSKHLDVWLQEHAALIDAAGELLLTNGLSNMVARRMHAHLLVLKSGLLYDALHEPRPDMSPLQPVHDLTTRKRVREFVLEDIESWCDDSEGGSTG